MDLSAAYPSAASALRGFAMIDRRHVLIVDEIAPKECLSTVDWQMHTAADVELGGATATLTCLAQNDSIEARRFYLRIIDPVVGRWTPASATPSDPPDQNPNKGIAKLVLRLEQVANPVRLAVLLSPDADVCAAPELPFAFQPLAKWV
jgi:hypothetical protein